MAVKIHSAGLVSLGLLALGVVAASESSDRSADLAAPFVLEAITRIPESGSSRPQQSNQYPWFGDFDGDGKPDLLMGDTDPETNRGRLRIYRNGGSAAEPAFDVPIWFHDLCPTGLIPWG